MQIDPFSDNNGLIVYLTTLRNDEDLEEKDKNLITLKDASSVLNGLLVKNVLLSSKEDVNNVLSKSDTASSSVLLIQAKDKSIYKYAKKVGACRNNLKGSSENV